MKRIIYTIFTSIFILSSLFAVDIRLGASYADKATMQVDQYKGGDWYDGRMVTCLKSDGTRYDARFTVTEEGTELETLGNLGTDVHFGIQDEGNIGLFRYDYDLSLSASLLTGKATYFGGSANVGIGNDKTCMFLSANKEYYSLYDDKVTEDITEVGVTVRIHEDLCKALALESELGAYIYPRFELSNRVSSNVREETFSTRLYARAVLDLGRFKGYIGVGITSWQLDNTENNGLVGGFIPTQVRNLFDVGVKVDLGSVGFFLDCSYFCDHPEATWVRIRTWDIWTNNAYEISRCGVVLEL